MIYYTTTMFTNVTKDYEICSFKVADFKGRMYKSYRFRRKYMKRTA